MRNLTKVIVDLKEKKKRKLVAIQRVCASLLPPFVKEIRCSLNLLQLFRYSFPLLIINFHIHLTNLCKFELLRQMKAVHGVQVF
jgi:hypothetical protein